MSKVQNETALDYNSCPRSGVEIANFSNDCEISQISIYQSQNIQRVSNCIHNSSSHATLDLDKGGSASSSGVDQRKEDPSSLSEGNRELGNPFLSFSDDQENQGISSSPAIHDQRRKKLCTRQWMKSPKCSVWGGNIKEVGTSKTACETMKETMMKIEMEVKTNINKKDSMIGEKGRYNAGAQVAPNSNNGSQDSNAELTQSQAVWESESLQGIAQLYLGSCVWRRSVFG